jgi:putative salt-induced outer membrane protein YdiY
MNSALLIFVSALPSNAPAAEASPLAAFVAQDAPQPAKNVWTGSVAVGATYQDGNTDARSANANALAEYRGEDDRWTVNGYWNYGETKDQATNDYVLTSRKAGLGVKYDYFLSEKLYAFANAGIETDKLADLQRRTFLGAGFGYQWQETDTLKWGSEAGAGYFDETRYESEDSDYIAARLANNIDWKINDKSSVIHLLTVFPSLEDADDVYSRSDLRFKTALTAAMFAQIQWVWDYDNTPAAGKDRNDNTVTLGLGWSF